MRVKKHLKKKMETPARLCDGNEAKDRVRTPDVLEAEVKGDEEPKKKGKEHKTVNQ